VFDAGLPKAGKWDSEMLMAEDVVKLVKDDIERLIGIVKRKPAKVYVYIPSEWKFELFSWMAEKRDANKIMKEAGAKYKERMEFVAKAMKSLGNRVYMMEKPVARKAMMAQMEDAKGFLERQFGCEVIVAEEEGAKHGKAALSTPMKPAIVLE
jgi:hypothetical protein